MSMTKLRTLLKKLLVFGYLCNTVSWASGLKYLPVMSYGKYRPFCLGPGVDARLDDAVPDETGRRDEPGIFYGLWREKRVRLHLRISGL